MQLPINIRADSDHTRCAEWVTACVILHNILISLRDEFKYAPEDADDDDTDVLKLRASVKGKALQKAVRDRWLKDVHRLE